MSLSEFPIPPLPPKGQEYRHTPPCKLHYTVWVYVWVWVSVSRRWCSRVRGKVIYCPVSGNGRKREYTALCSYKGIIHSLFNLSFKIALTVFLLINVHMLIHAVVCNWSVPCFPHGSGLVCPVKTFRNCHWAMAVLASSLINTPFPPFSHYLHIPYFADKGQRRSKGLQHNARLCLLHLS